MDEKMNWKHMSTAPQDRWLALLLAGHPVPQIVCGGWFPQAFKDKGAWCHAVVSHAPDQGFLAACSPVGWAELGEIDMEMLRRKGGVEKAGE